MVSVVIPLYNKQDYIAFTLSKVFDQTYTHFEVIVVDDGSSDNSLTVVNSFQDSRLKLIKQPNQGVAVARNTGIQAATGEYIALLDADDYWAPDFLLEMVQAAKAFPGFNIFASGRISVFENYQLRYQNPLLPLEGNTAEVDYIQIIANYLPSLHSSNGLIRKRTFLEAGLFIPGQKNHEDHALWLKMTATQNLIFVNKPLCYYQKNVPKSASGNVLRFSDYITYLERIKETAAQLDKKRLDFFRTYYQKFILFSFIKYQKGFNQEQQSSIKSLVLPLLSGSFKCAFLTITFLPRGWVYQTIRLFKKIKP